MANSSKKAIEEFLDESFEDESDISNVYDSDADPEYRPGENNNFYNSVTLSNILLEKKTHTTGTLRSNPNKETQRK